MIALEKLFGAVMMVFGVFSLCLCLIYIAESNYASEAEYAQMAQEIVDQSVDSTIAGNCLK